MVVLKHGPEALPLVGLMAGILLVLMGLLGFGRLIRYVPSLVVVGFTAGIALSIAFGQLNLLLGVTGTDPALAHFTEKLWDTIKHLDTVTWVTPLMGVGAIAFLFWWAGRRWRIPGALIAIVALTAIVWGLGVETQTLAGRYGEMPTGFPVPTAAFFSWNLALDLIPSAAAIAVLAGLESLLSAMVADGMAPAGPRHDPNRELVGQGLANIVSPFFHGIPATAAIARTGAAIRNGATSRLAGVVHALVVLAAAVLIGTLSGHIPLTVLAAVLIVTAWKIADVPEVVRLFRSANREDLLVLASTMVVTLVFDLSYAIAIGVIISMLVMIRHLMRVPAARELVPNAQGDIQQVSRELSGLMRSRPDIAYFTASGVISFHCAAAFEYQLRRDDRPLILRMKDVAHIDTTGLITLQGIVEHRKAHGRRLMLSAVQPDVLASLKRFGIVDLLGPENIFERTRDAIAAVPPPEKRDHAHGARAPKEPGPATAGA